MIFNPVFEVTYVIIHVLDYLEICKIHVNFLLLGIKPRLFGFSHYVTFYGTQKYDHIKRSQFFLRPNKGSKIAFQSVIRAENAEKCIFICLFFSLFPSGNLSPEGTLINQLITYLGLI